MGNRKSQLTWKLCREREGTLPFPGIFGARERPIQGHNNFVHQSSITGVGATFCYGAQPNVGN